MMGKAKSQQPAKSVSNTVHDTPMCMYGVFEKCKSVPWKSDGKTCSFNFYG